MANVYLQNDKLLNFDSNIKSIPIKYETEEKEDIITSTNGDNDYVDDPNYPIDSNLEEDNNSQIDDNDNNQQIPSDIERQIQQLLKSVEELKSGIGYKWYDSVKVTNSILNNRNIIILPNNRLFSDYDSKCIMIFVNDKYVSPNNYQIINKNSFYFKYDDIIQLNDIIHIIYFDKSNIISNYDSQLFAIAKSWQFEYTNDTDEALQIITLDNSISFQNPDKYSLLVYIDNKFVNPNNYDVPNTRELIFKNDLRLNQNETILIIQLSQILPNEEYVGYVWGETITVGENSDTFTISKDHSFINVNDTSALIFINDKITKDYEILNSTQIKFNNIVNQNSIITIIQLGYVADINKLKESLDIETIKNLLNIDTRNYIKEESRNKSNGFVGLNDDSLIDSNLIDIDTLALKIKRKFVDNGWIPNNSGTSNHTHPNFDVLWKLQLYEGRLYCNGYPVGERVTESFIDIVLTENMINNCGFTLPDDCDSDRPLTLTINSIPALHDNDWYLIEHDYPTLDEISWKNKLPQQLLEIGDIATVTYYKKSQNKIAPPLEPGSSGYDHYHENLRLLNALSINELYELCINGISVAESSIETDIDYIITQKDIDRKYVELPNDCDGSRPIVVTLANVRMMQGIDYQIVLNKWPIRDQVNWNELDLDNVIQVDDPMCITYYKKNLIQL